MKANPGGLIAPNEVFGRDSLISQLWERLEQQSVVLSAERRIGKTSIIRKMKAEGRGKLVVYRDLENVGSPVEFAEVLLEDVEQYLSKFNQTARKARDFLRQLSGTEISGGGVGVKVPSIAAPHWKRIVTATFEDLIEHQGDQVQIILLWDKVPWMLQKIAQKESQSIATEVLDTLRSIRQTYATVRMVFTGSIGLHHVLDDFRASGYSNAATNDMYVVNVPALNAESAQSLAEELLRGGGFEFTDADSRTKVAGAIAVAVDYVPFYIHHVVVRLKSCQYVDLEALATVIEAALTDSQDQWQLKHYYDRLKTYYGEEDKYQYALGILDSLTEAAQPLTLNELMNRLQVQLGKNSDRELTRAVIDLLKRDHYLVQEGTQYRFQFPLIKRYWQLSRGLV